MAPPPMTRLRILDCLIVKTQSVCLAGIIEINAGLNVAYTAILAKVICRSTTKCEAPPSGFWKPRYMAKENKIPGHTRPEHGTLNSSSPIKHMSF